MTITIITDRERELQAQVVELQADRDSLRDALAALVPVVEAINGDLSPAAWHALEDARHVLGAPPASAASNQLPGISGQLEPACPSCSAPGMLFECVHCGANNYPPEDLTAPELRAGIALQLREIERLRAEVKALLPDAQAYRSMGGRPLAHEGET